MPRRNAKRGEYRRFGSIRILADGRVRFSPWTLPGLPLLDFTAIHDSDHVEPNYTIDANWRGRGVFLVFLTRHRVESACFAYDLNPESLREAVSVLRDAGNGLERWIIPGLESTQRGLSSMKDSANSELLAVIPELLESMRELPVAPQWKKRLRFLERWERENAGAPNEGDRPSAEPARKTPPRSQRAPSKRAR